MEGAITSKDLSIGKLFDDFYVVPNYQREFVWGEQEVRKLVDDIYAEFVSGGDEHQIEYFVGSMVVCARGDGTHEVIDGQQRLTTFWIFFVRSKNFSNQTKSICRKTLVRRLLRSISMSVGRRRRDFESNYITWKDKESSAFSLIPPSSGT